MKEGELFVLRTNGRSAVVRFLRYVVPGQLVTSAEETIEAEIEYISGPLRGRRGRIRKE